MKGKSDGKTERALELLKKGLDRPTICARLNITKGRLSRIVADDKARREAESTAGEAA